MFWACSIPLTIAGVLYWHDELRADEEPPPLVTIVTATHRDETQNMVGSHGQNFQTQNERQQIFQSCSDATPRRKINVR